jgi:hypothetical protein
MLSSGVFANHHLPPIDLVDSCGATSILFPSRDDKPVTATPLESAFTNCDVHNPFRMRIYENCRVYINNSHSETWLSSPSNIVALFFRSRYPAFVPQVPIC